MLKTKICAISLVAVLALLAGCSKGESESLKAAGSSPTTGSTTTTGTAATTPTPPAQEPGREHLTVEYDHCGLHFKLDDTYTVGLQDDNKNIFTFSNDKISGTVTFGKLSEIGNGAKTSQEYATLLMEIRKDEAPYVGSSTGFAYYINSANAETRTAEALYIYGEYAWVIKAQCSASEAKELLIPIIGRCGYNTDEIPVE